MRRATLLREKGERRRHSARGLREIPPAEGTPEGVSPLLRPAARGAAGLRTGDGDRELGARTRKISPPAGADENGSPALPWRNYNDIKDYRRTNFWHGLVPCSKRCGCSPKPILACSFSRC